MAAIRDFAFTEGTTAAVSWSALMPTHVSGDVLVAFVTTTGVNAWTDPTAQGWTNLQAVVAGTGHNMGVYYKTAASSSETLSIATLSVAAAYTTTVIAVMGVNTSDIVEDFQVRTADDATTPFAGVVVNTAVNNCLVITGLAADTGIAPTQSPGWIGIFNGDSGGSCGVTAFTYKRSSGAVAAMDWYGQVNDNTMAWTLALNDDGNDNRVAGYIDPGDSPGEILEFGYWITGAAANAMGNIYAAALTNTTCGAKTAVFDAGSVVADSGINPYTGSLGLTPAAYTNGASIGMTQINWGSIIGTPHSLTGKLLVTSYMFATPRDWVDMATAKDVGGISIILMVRDATTYYAWHIGCKNDQTTSKDARNYVAIQCDQSTSTRYANSGTPTISESDGIVVGALGVYGAVLVRFSCFFLLDEISLVGGSETYPLDFLTMEGPLNACVGLYPVMLRSGSAATFMAPIKFGGTDPIHIIVDLRTLQYRKQADGVDYNDWHVDNNRCGWEFDGQAGDIIKFTNCVFTAGSPTYWRFNSSHSAATVMDFSGTSVINANVTLRSTVSLDGMAFVNCGTFTQNGATITNTEFTNTKVTSASPGDADNISNSTFTKTTGTQHAMEIGGTVANMTLTNVDFTGYAASDGSTGNEAVYVNTSAGSMTISISGGTIPSIRVAAGVTVTVQNAVTVKVTVKDAISLAVIENARILMEAASVSSGTHTGSDNASVLTDGNKSFTVNELVGYRIYNTTDGSSSTITANTETTVTGVLAGGTENDWDTNDIYFITNLPAGVSVTITNSGTTATVTHTSHGLATGNQVKIKGASHTQNNGVFTITLDGGDPTNKYTYTMGSAPGSSPTGSITSTSVILFGATTAGILQTTTFNYTSPQPITGKVRRASTGTKYKTGAITGTITSNGLDTTVLLISDE